MIGIDQDGRLVVFELKRGTLTRDAVAQVLDYTSDLHSMDADRFARLIEETSGRYGIEKIKNFDDWYSQNFPDRGSVLEESPKMFLVGLGADSRALRIVNFLAESGVDVALLTFNAFNQDSSLFLARQIESVSPSPANIKRSRSQNKERNLQALNAFASQLGVAEFMNEVANFVEQKIPVAYKYPGKTGFSFYLHEYLGRPKRVYVTVSLDQQSNCPLYIYFYKRAVYDINDVISLLTDAFENQCSVIESGDFKFSIPENQWLDLIPVLEKVFEKITQGWKNNISDQKSSEDDPLVES